MRANYPKIYALDNRGVPGMEHCFGAPFLAKDFDAAVDMVKQSIEKYKDDLSLENFYLCELGCYVFDNSENPFESALGNEVKVCVADFFAEEPDEDLKNLCCDLSENEMEDIQQKACKLREDPGDEAPSTPGCDEGIMTGVGFYDDLEVNDEKA